MTEKEKQATVTATTTTTAASKVIASDVVHVRGARGKENPPIIVSIPKIILNAARLRKGDEVRIYTDGARVYLEKLEVPAI